METKDVAMSEFEMVLSKSNLSTVDLSEHELSVVRFWAPWCESCRTMEEHMNELLMKEKGGFKAYSLNIDRNRELAESLSVKYLPEMVVLKSGKEIGRIVGELAYDDFEDALSSYC